MFILKSVDLKSKKVKQYTIVATDELIEKEVENIQNRYGNVIPQEVTEEHSNVTGNFVNEEKEINKKATFLVNDLKGKKNEKKLIGTKVGDVVELETKKLFADDHKLEQILGVSHDEAHDLDITVQFTVEEINITEKAELDQELFEKLFADGSVKTVTELKAKIKEDAEKQFQQQADQQLLNSVTESLVENTKFDLPKEFLQKWLQTAGEKQLTAEEAVAEYEKSEKGLRYQLIVPSIN
jgi:trigger factor